MLFSNKTIKTIIFIVLSITIKLNLFSKQEDNIFKIIANQHLPAYAKPSLSHQEIISVINQETGEINRKKIKELFAQKTKEAKNKKIALSLFEEWAKHKKQKPTDLCKTSKMLLQNLEILCGQNTTGSHLLSKISRTKSIVGNIMFAKMLMEPTTNITELLRRQNIIKELINNEDLFNQLNSIIEKYQQIEQELLTFWEEKTFNRLFSSDYYFPTFPVNVIYKILPKEFAPSEKLKNKINKTPALIGGLTLWNNYSTYNNIKMNIGVGLWNKWKIFLDLLHNKNKTDTNPDNQFSSFINSIKKPFNWSREKARSIAPNIVNNTENIAEKLSGWGPILFMFQDMLFSSMQVYGTLKHEKKKLARIKVAYSKLTKAATTINSLIDIKKIINSSSILKENIKCLDALNFFFENKIGQSKEFDQLLKLLSSHTFKENKSAFSYLLFARGKILATSYLMSKTQNHLIDFLHSIGQIDTYLSIAKLYKELLNNNAQFSFATYIEQENPYINAEEFWTPFIDPSTVITNNIELGNINSSRNALISGPNAGGKSTILKSIIINALLAQTITIVPANNLILTPFYYLDTYLNIIDDITAGNSLFKSEVLRVKKLIQTIKNNDLKKCLIIMDEMFSGTNPLEGEAASYAIGKFLTQFTNSIIIIASHYPKMTELEVETNGIFKNYNVSVEEDQINNQLIFPFTLNEGPTDKTIAIKILQAEEFDSQIINDAYKVIKENIVK